MWNKIPTMGYATIEITCNITQITTSSQREHDPYIEIYSCRDTCVITQITTTSQRQPTRQDIKTTHCVSTKEREGDITTTQELAHKHHLHIEKVFEDGQQLINHRHFKIVIYVGLFRTHTTNGDAYTQTHTHTQQRRGVPMQNKIPTYRYSTVDIDNYHNKH